MKYASTSTPAIRNPFSVEIEMDANETGRQFQDTTQSRTIRPKDTAPETGTLGINQATLRRVTSLIELGTLIVNSMIGLRFLLKLLAANPNNIFAQLVYFFTAPFLAVFIGLTNTPSFQGIVIEFYDLIAIMVYFILSWVVVRLLWILLARLKPN